MRLIFETAVAVAMVINQVITPVQIPFTETAKAAEAEAIVPSTHTLTVTNKMPAVAIKSTKGTFDTDVVAPLKAAQAAKAAEEARKAEEARAAAATAAQVRNVSTKPVVVPELSGDDATYKLFIYNRESGNNPTRQNASGCIGLGQACPGSKLLAVCPTLDYACEDAYFTNYAIRRYGSWAGAYAFWITHHWW